jgi:hypothetical protein
MTIKSAGAFASSAPVEDTFALHNDRADMRILLFGRLMEKTLKQIVLTCLSNLIEVKHGKMRGLFR